MKTSSLFSSCGLVCLIAFTGCSAKFVPPTASLSAEPATIIDGQATVLKWTSTNGAIASITGIGGDGGVPLSGQMSVKPAKTTTYVLTVASGGEQVTSSATVTVNEPPPRPKIACWGDSLTFGSEDNTGVTYPNVLAGLTGDVVYNGGVGGNTSTQIAARMLADTSRYGDVTIIWAGRNNYDQFDQVMSDIASMIAALTEPKRFLVMSVLNGELDHKGYTGYLDIIKINTALAAKYPDNYIDIREMLVNDYDPNDPQDVFDFSIDAPPSSLRIDWLHLNAKGYTFVAEQAAKKLRQNGYVN